MTTVSFCIFSLALINSTEEFNNFLYTSLEMSWSCESKLTFVLFDEVSVESLAFCSDGLEKLEHGWLSIKDAFVLRFVHSGTLELS